MNLSDVADTTTELAAEPLPAAKVGRRPTLVEQARRKQIVACAAELIAEHGYANATVTHIAERAAISKAAVLYHFEDEEEILRQVRTETLDGLAAHLSEALRDAASPPDAVAAYARALVAYLADHPAGVLMLAENAASTERWQPVADIFFRGQQTDHFRDFDTRTAAVCLQGAISAIAAEAFADPGYDRAAAAEALIEFTLRATVTGS